ncbi:MAG TPA: nuclear transport factor 2 family protein [Calditrichia bacterium]|nr:nuclear transport factor 2 family protein [Calditrichota bacterium]HQU71577.1 nuclear transport factor 2 family protein [Calditrichia bacterium]HQV30520.1 nuclear transport factor 2 family protein [Calditrichia bacterium]
MIPRFTGRIFIAFSLFLLISTVLSANTEEDIKAVVTSAYVEGIHIERNPEKVRAGFHPDFTMNVLKENKLVKISLDQWLSGMESGKKPADPQPRPNVTHEFALVSVSGSAAVVRVELYRDGKHLFSDFLNLYQFEDGWKIVAKTFYRHP